MRSTRLERALRTVGALLLGLCFATAHFASAPGSAFAEDDPPPAKAEPAVEKVQWIDGWQAGRADAKKRGRLLLVYVHRTSPT